MTAVLLLGGARSGKSALAMKLATPRSTPGVVVFGVRGVDEEFDSRIDRHRSERPANWKTVDATKSASWTDELGDIDVLVVDCVGTWLSLAASTSSYEVAEARVGNQILSLIQSGRDVIFVSNEVGMSLTPLTELGRSHTDSLGRLNQMLARLCDRSFLVVGGCAIELNTSAPIIGWSVHDPEI